MLYKVPDRKYELIQQRKSYDCVVACLAMFLGEEYEMVSSMLKRMGWRADLEIGVSDQLTIALMKRFGHKPVRSFHLHPIPSLVIVPSLNSRYGLHCVFYDGDEKIYDPLQGVSKFKNYYHEDFAIGRVVAKSITCEKFFETPLSHEFSHTVPCEGFKTPRDKEMEGLVKRMVKNMHHWDEREQPINRQFKWQLEEAEKILESRGINVGEKTKRTTSVEKVKQDESEQGTIRI